MHPRPLPLPLGPPTPQSTALAVLLGLAVACGGAPDKPDPARGHADSAGDSGGADGADGGGRDGDVRRGELCPSAEKIGEVYLIPQGAGLYVGGRIFDAPSPWIGPPVAATEACEHHAYDPASCGGPCPAGEVCGLDGVCAPEPRVRFDVRLEVEVDREFLHYEPDPTAGYFAGEAPMVDLLDGVRLTVGGEELVVSALPVGGALPDLVVRAESDTLDAPGQLTVSWSPAPAGTLVRTVIPMNHHASAPTFTTCAAPVESGGFVVPAEMVDPLAVVTGLEFQGCGHVGAAAMRFTDGCVDVYAGAQLLVSPTTP